MFLYTENTQNPINAFKTTSYNTKHTNNTKIHFNKSKMFEHSNKFQKTKERVNLFY